VSDIDHPKLLASFMMMLRPSGIRRAVLVYSFSIRSGDSTHRAVLGCMSLLNDCEAIAFGNDVIGDMLHDNVDQYVGWTMDIAEGERVVCSIAFSFLSRDRKRA
jgi:hypothetical protein